MKIFLAVIATLACAAASPLNTRVVGGTDAEHGSAPYQASLQIDGWHFCGGAILNSRWILTAAHCLKLDQDITVAVGMTKLNETGDVYEVEKQILHPEYDRYDIVNDIALIKVRTPIRFHKFVQRIPICMRDVGTGEIARATGWGLTDVNGKVAKNELQEVYQLTIDRVLCEGMVYRALNDKQICAYRDKGEGLCMGDSGGPLVVNGELVGIVSWGKPCAIGFPDVFSKPKSYLSWIVYTMITN